MKPEDLEGAPYAPLVKKVVGGFYAKCPKVQCPFEYNFPSAPEAFYALSCHLKEFHLKGKSGNLRKGKIPSRLRKIWLKDFHLIRGDLR